MNRDQFLRALRRYAKVHELGDVGYDARKGKGGHAEVSLGERFTIIPSGELKRGTKEAILKKLGLPKDAI